MTTADLPAPPVPADLDLRDCQWMPLDVVRLRDSELAMVHDAEAFRACVLSWCVAWHQVPAGSLPADDATQARLLGYGRDLKTWRRIRDRGGLRGWVLHADGRLYHQVVAEKAHEAKGQRDRAAKKREADRKRKDDWRRTREGHADEDVPPDVTCDRTPDGTRDNDPCHTVNLTVPDRTSPNRNRSTPPPASPAVPAATAAGMTVQPYDPLRMLAAVNSGDLLAVVACAGGNIERGPEWTREAAGQRLGTIAAVLDWRLVDGDPIREPSGLRAALLAWKCHPADWRRAYARDFAASIGLPVLSQGADARAEGAA